jgi:hypothetical protein
LYKKEILKEMEGGMEEISGSVEAAGMNTVCFSRPAKEEYFKKGLNPPSSVSPVL